MEYMLTFHILNVYVDNTQPHQFKFTFNKWFILKWSQMQYYEQFVTEIQKIKPLRTCVSYYMTFPKHIYGVSVLRFVLQTNVDVDTRFSPDKLQNAKYTDQFSDAANVV